MSTRVMPQVMSEFFLSKVLARSETVRETVLERIVSSVQRKRRVDGTWTYEKVKGIPSPSAEADEEEEPLLRVQHPQKTDWIGDTMHWRLEGRKASPKVLPNAHVLRRVIAVILLCLDLVPIELLHIVDEVESVFPRDPEELGCSFTNASIS